MGEITSSALILASCGSPDNTPSQMTNATPIKAAEIGSTISQRDRLRICIGGISFRNGTEIKIAAINRGELIHLSYVRDDGKPFAYDCKIEGNQVRYRMIDEAGRSSGPGRWSGAGSKTTFKTFADEIEFTDTFADGSIDRRRIKI